MFGTSAPANVGSGHYSRLGPQICGTCVCACPLLPSSRTGTFAPELLFSPCHLSSLLHRLEVDAHTLTVRRMTPSVVTRMGSAAFGASSGLRPLARRVVLSVLHRRSMTARRFRMQCLPGCAHSLRRELRRACGPFTGSTRHSY